MFLKLKPHLNSKHVISALIFCILIAGLFITIYGFYGLISTTPGAVSWRWSYRYLILFLILFALISLIGIWHGPIKSGLIVAIILVVGLGAFMPLVGLVFLGLSAYALGRLTLIGTEISVSDSILVGIAVAGTLFGLLAHFPINSSGTWGLLIFLVLLFGWPYVKQLVKSLPRLIRVDLHLYFLYSAIGAASLLHLLVVLMPEVGHDALAVHLFIPTYIEQHHMWSFDVATYVWAVTPMLIDWIYSIGYLISGEQGARLVNLGGILITGVMTYRISLWASSEKKSSLWAVLFYLTTPLTFLESSSLFIEAIWSALVLGGMLALLRLTVNTSSRVNANLVLAGILFGGALAAKAVTMPYMLLILIIFLYGFRSQFNVKLLPIFGFSIFCFIIIGGIHYFRAFLIADNPVFPFFNSYFKSPFYPPVNFSPPAIFERGLSLDTFFNMTFNSWKFLEGTPGASGFQWLTLALPGFLISLFLRQTKALIIGFIAFGSIWLVFNETAYLRYIFPSLALICSLIGSLIAVSMRTKSEYRYFVFLLIPFVLVINLLHFSSATWYGNIDFEVISNDSKKNAYFDGSIPGRSVVKILNALNQNSNPVAFFSAPNIAGLKADALLVSWYNPRFSGLVLSAKSANELGIILARENVEYLVVDDHFKSGSFAFNISQISKEIARINSISIRKLDDSFRYTTELLQSSAFGNGWNFDPGVIHKANKGLEVSVASAAHATVRVSPGKKYRYIANASCSYKPAPGRLQINWLDEGGNLIGTDIKVFDCMTQLTSYSMDVIAPKGAEQALIYASGHTLTPIIFKKVSFLH